MEKNFDMRNLVLPNIFCLFLAPSQRGFAINATVNKILILTFNWQNRTSTKLLEVGRYNLTVQELSK